MSLMCISVPAQSARSLAHTRRISEKCRTPGNAPDETRRAASSFSMQTCTEGVTPRSSKARLAPPIPPKLSTSMRPSFVPCCLCRSPSPKRIHPSADRSVEIVTPPPFSEASVAATELSTGTRRSIRINGTRPIATSNSIARRWARSCEGRRRDTACHKLSKALIVGRRNCIMNTHIPPRMPRSLTDGNSFFSRCHVKETMVRALSLDGITKPARPNIWAPRVTPSRLLLTRLSAE